MAPLAARYFAGALHGLEPIVRSAPLAMARTEGQLSWLVGRTVAEEGHNSWDVDLVFALIYEKCDLCPPLLEVLKEIGAFLQEMHVSDSQRLCVLDSTENDFPIDLFPPEQFPDVFRLPITSTLNLPPLPRL
uniref:Uncharacterized protein n=1 Tax=Eutreptiella gymnastica TaxID=73025 RepID=A0A7S1NFR2_9EUGL